LPVRYRCSKCGYILYEFNGVGQSYMGLLTPSEVAKLVGHICPNCKSIINSSESIFSKVIIKQATPQALRESIRYSIHGLKQHVATEGV